MTAPIENAGTRRKSSAIAALMTLGNLPNIPIINEPIAVAADKKKSLRFDTNTTEYESEEARENKKQISDEIKQWVHAKFMFNQGSSLKFVIEI